MTELLVNCRSAREKAQVHAVEPRTQQIVNRPLQVPRACKNTDDLANVLRFRTRRVLRRRVPPGHGFYQRGKGGVHGRSAMTCHGGIGASARCQIDKRHQKLGKDECDDDNGDVECSGDRRAPRVARSALIRSDRVTRNSRPMPLKTAPRGIRHLRVPKLSCGVSEAVIVTLSALKYPQPLQP